MTNKIEVFSKGIRNGHKKPIELNEQGLELYKSSIETIENDFSSASAEARKECTTCVGKGFYDMDNILPNGIDIRDPETQKRVRHTPPQRYLCDCVKKNVRKEIAKLYE